MFQNLVKVVPERPTKIPMPISGTSQVDLVDLIRDPGKCDKIVAVLFTISHHNLVTVIAS